MTRVRLLLAAALLAAVVVAVPARAAPASVDRAWLQRTLAFEYRLASSVPLRNAPWIGTQDSVAQRLSLTRQLDLGVRSLELGAHYLNTPRVGGGKAVVACETSCGKAPLMEDPLGELRRWLTAHPTEVVLLVVEDGLGDAAGHDAAARVFAEALGKRLYAPPAGGACAPMPLGIARKDVRDAGAQV